MITIDTAGFAPRDAYHFLMGTILPRPIAFVTSLGAGNVVNAAPFSSFVALSTNPPIVGFVVSGEHGEPKDTLNNIERLGEYVVNTVPEDLASEVQRCSERFPPEIGELDVTGLAVTPSSIVAPPRVTRSPISLECRLDSVVPFGRTPDRLVAGLVVCAHIRADIYKNGRIDTAAWRPLGRVGGRMYCRVGEMFQA